MKYTFLLMGLMLFFLTGCNDSRSHKISESKGQAINEANANNKLISQALAPYQEAWAALLNYQWLKIDAAMEDAPESMKANATFTLAQLQNESKELVDAERKKTEEWKKKFEEERVGFWGGLLQWGGWAGLGGAGLWLASAFNVPFVNILKDPLVRALAGKTLTDVEAQADAWSQKAGIAHTAIASSEAGSTGLKYLDAKLKTHDIDIEKHVENLSRGRATTIQGLFKLLAQGHASDEGSHADVKAVLKEVRDKNNTEGGEMVSVIKQLNVGTPVKMTHVINNE